MMHRFYYGLFRINDDWTIDVYVDNYFLQAKNVFRESLESMITPFMKDARKELVRAIACGKDDLEPKKIIFTPPWQTRRTVHYVGEFYPWLKR